MAEILKKLGVNYVDDPPSDEDYTDEVWVIEVSAQYLGDGRTEKGLVQQATVVTQKHEDGSSGKAAMVVITDRLVHAEIFPSKEAAQSFIDKLKTVVENTDELAMILHYIRPRRIELRTKE